MRLTSKLVAAVGLSTVLAATAACSGAGGAGGVGGGGGGASDNSINVLMVNNPQMLALQKHIGEFTKQSGITVNFTVKPENDMRNQAAQEFANQSGQFDVATLSNFEVPIYSKNGWLTPLDDIPAYKADTTFDQADIFPSMTKSLTGPDGKLYGEPFYGESSFLMYRKDIAEKVGVKFNETPTWDEVAAAAAKMDGAESGMKGICLRGLPGWGEVFAPLTTVVNTFGGTWFDKDWNAQVNAQPFKDATTFYTDLVKAHGEAGAAQAGFAECLTATTQSKTAMWYDATSAAGSLEAPDSPVKGKMGYVQAPVKETKASGWLYAWSWMIEKKSTKADNAWKFISWASGKDYENLVGQQDGWATVPAGKRESTYANADYIKAAGAFAEPTKTAIESADPTNPGVQPRPTVGIQFVDIPEFTDFATKISQDISGVIAGKTTVDEALDNGQKLAQAAGDKYKGK
ncbi:extracellular solute-binding protein [Microlunatus antarcticus]|uniref:Sorbitol/mannitol transport system substrate-binding protein n=1 Tax=Microlunatus antarcticus TaxID=53388 RepID=A0A7W5P5W1_9ACTN|nr:extracellular solute-binding protein [Microlunatus antarcticus]MBB3325864.1 sorbitol/mannitol transport system substrate-binding protein [Microlunatus antarcticus]